jgi:hypothetical protein
MKRGRNLLWGCFGLFIILSLSTPAFPVNISGYSDIGLGIEDPLGSGSTGAGTGEAGNFVYITFTADTPIQLLKATYNFTGKDVEWDGDINFVPINKDGVSSFSLFPAVPPAVQVFGFDATGFDSGEFLFYGMNLDKPSIGHTGTPVGTDYVGGTLTVDFAGGITAVGTFAAFDPSVPLSFGNARATFSFSGGGDHVIPEPSTMLLLGSGLIGLAGYGRKKLFRK